MNRFLLYISVILISCIGCKEFIEPSLKNQKIGILGPADNLESNSYQQTFWWSTHEDALGYRLQIVSPTFDSVAKLSLDTLIIADKFIYTIDPGKYQWRIRAENGSSHTEYQRHNLTIYPSSLSEQLIQLAAPANNLYSANPVVKYEWLKLFGASQYRLQVDENGFSDTTKLIVDILTNNLSFPQSLTKDAIYQFRVRGENSTQNSKWSPMRTFTFDTTPPNQVSLVFPGNKQSVTKPVKLSWSAIAGAEKYKVAVYKSDSTMFDATYPRLTTTTEQVFNAGDSNEKLIWRVKAIDRAGNEGAFSNYYSFTLQ